MYVHKPLKEAAGIDPKMEPEEKGYPTNKAYIPLHLPT